MRDQYFYGHGKLLLSGEYLVLDGAQSLALPTTVGQSMTIKYRQSYQPTLNWKSTDHSGKVWFESDFEFWHFNPIRKTDEEKQLFIQKVLKAVRTLNPHFLRDDVDVFVETKLEFPIDWGLGSSSTLLYNIAQWAYVSPFELLKRSLGGSGYDVACAQSMGPIHYQLIDQKPQWSMASFDPKFKDNLFFIYLGKKQDSQAAVASYRGQKIENKKSYIDQISLITKEMTTTGEISSFNRLIVEHEKIMSEVLGVPTIKEQRFSDYWGEVKSLGAWGGDFVLVTSEREFSETRDYFVSKGLETIIPFEEIVHRGKLN
ncbi:MAG: GYDIA family GHMP kinase [Bacteriovoracaceae bacterium]